MVELRDAVMVREPLAAEFETVIHNLRPLSTGFLFDLILSLEALAAHHDYSVVLAAAESGSITFRWKLMIVTVFSAQTLSIAADGAQVSDFMANVWRDATHQEGGKPSNDLGKTICHAIDNGEIQSITFAQKGGDSNTIDHKTFEIEPQTKQPGRIYPDTGSQGANIVPQLGNALTQSMIVTVHMVKGKAYFEVNGSMGRKPVIEYRWEQFGRKHDELIHGHRYIVVAKKFMEGGSHIGWTVYAAHRA